MAEREDKALVPVAINFVVEVPIQVTVGAAELKKRFNLDTVDFFDHQGRVRAIADDLKKAILAEAAKTNLKTDGVDMEIVSADGVLANKTVLEIDIEACGLGESAI